MVKYIEEMKQARAIGDLMLVDELSVRVKRHGKRSKELNERASELIFASAYIFPSMINDGNTDILIQKTTRFVDLNDQIYRA